MIISTHTAPDLMDKKIRSIYIKNGRRSIQTDSGVMRIPAGLSRTMFGRMRGGKYSNVQKTK